MIYADDVLQYTKEEIWALIHDEEPFTMMFDDTSLEVTWRENLLSWYFWEYHRQYPRIPILVNHHIQGFYLTDGLQIKLSERIVEEIRKWYPDENEENILTLTYQIEQAIRIDFGESKEVVRYMRSLDAESFVRIYKNEKIRNIIESTPPTRTGIHRGYDLIRDELMNNPDLSNDEIACSVRENGTKLGQCLQMIGYRGFTSEMNQSIFPNPVMSNYSTGIRRLSAFAQGSRDATKALMATVNPVKLTEYFNREMQLFTMSIKEIRLRDCGSTATIPWRVKTDDLDGIINGAYYYDEVGQLREVRKKDRHLIGQTINIRTAAYCQEKEDGVYCLCCTGSLGLQMEWSNGKSANAGYLMTVAQNKKITQDTISTKHLLLSAVGETYVIDTYYKKFISNFEDGLELYLSTEMIGKNFKLSFRTEDLKSLAFLNQFNDEEDKVIEGIPLQNYSLLEDVIFLIDDETGQRHYKPEIVALSHGAFKPSLSYEMLRYIRDKGLTQSNGRSTVDMMDWNIEYPMFQLPVRHSSTLDYMKEIKQYLFGGDTTKNKNDNAWRYHANYDDPELLYRLISDTVERINVKFKVNYGIVNIIVVALMARNPSVGDYRPPKLFTGKSFCSYNSIMSGRSLSAWAAHEKQKEIIVRPESYVHRIRSNHPMDFLVTDVPEYTEIFKEEAKLGKEYDKRKNR